MRPAWTQRNSNLFLARGGLAIVRDVHSRSVSSAVDFRRAGWWLLLATGSAFLILYGSLFPFRTRTDVDLEILRAMGTLTFKPATRGGVPQESWKVMNVRFELENAR